METKNITETVNFKHVYFHSLPIGTPFVHKNNDYIKSGEHEAMDGDGERGRVEDHYGCVITNTLFNELSLTKKDIRPLSLQKYSIEYVFDPDNSKYVEVKNIITLGYSEIDAIKKACISILCTLENENTGDLMKLRKSTLGSIIENIRGDIQELYQKLKIYKLSFISVTETEE